MSCPRRPRRRPFSQAPSWSLGAEPAPAAGSCSRVARRREQGEGAGHLRFGIRPVPAHSHSRVHTPGFCASGAGQAAGPPFLTLCVKPDAAGPVDNGPPRNAGVRGNASEARASRMDWISVSGAGLPEGTVFQTRVGAPERVRVSCVACVAILEAGSCPLSSLRREGKGGKAMRAEVSTDLCPRPPEMHALRPGGQPRTRPAPCGFLPDSCLHPDCV